jgi:Heterokaryon incompatibility protein (HET)
MPIECNGFTLLITPNCKSALRLLGRSFSYRLLWIDSTSIDQTCIEERKEQVSIMADIYKQAESVIVWLGEGNSCSDRIMALFELFHASRPFDSDLDATFMTMLIDKITEIEEGSTPCFPFGKMKLQADVNEVFRAFPRLSSSSETRLSAFEEIFNRSWFYRMWTIRSLHACKL